MGIRTVRLEEETEKALAEIVTVTGLSVSAAMKKGLLVLRRDMAREARRIPYDIYKELDLGPGGRRRIRHQRGEAGIVPEAQYPEFDSAVDVRLVREQVTGVGERGERRLGGVLVRHDPGGPVQQVARFRDVDLEHPLRAIVVDAEIAAARLRDDLERVHAPPVIVLGGVAVCGSGRDSFDGGAHGRGRGAGR